MATMLVTGGTGTLGAPTAAKLRDDGHDVRVLSRKQRPDRHGVVTGDLITGAGIDAALEGVDTVVHCATTAFAFPNYGRKEFDATRTLVESAERADSPPHLVYISIVGVDKVPLYYYRAKLECEDFIRNARLPWTILRATQFHDLVARMVNQPLPAVVVPAHISFQPIDAHDVATRLAQLAAAAPAGSVPDIGGPQVATAAELARTYHAAKGRRRRVVEVAVPGKTSARYRAGWHLTPDNRYGTVTFADWVAEH